MSHLEQLCMKLLDLTLDSPASNLALDEALLETAIEAQTTEGCLRLWEPASLFVVIGRSSRSSAEVNLSYCRENGIPVLRRSSGGAAIVTGPGCLMYAVVLSYDLNPGLVSIDAAHRYVLSLNAAALRDLGVEAELRGTSDLAVQGKKVSGNSLRCKRTHFLYHGTLLCQFDLGQVEACLGVAPRQPEYRQGRSHAAFVTNLDVPTGELKRAIIDRWQARDSLFDWPKSQTSGLAATKYVRDDWNLRL